MFHIYKKLHIFIGYYKIHISIRLHVRRVCGFRKSHCAKLDNVANAELCGGYAVFSGDLSDGGVLEGFAVGYGRIRLDLNILLLAIIHKRSIRIADVQ